MSTFDNATLMITGGTGSFGSTVLKHFLDSDLKEIRIFSRDEKKQDDMRHELQAKHPERPIQRTAIAMKTDMIRNKAVCRMYCP